jgi:hypothetical protein
MVEPETKEVTPVGAEGGLFFLHATISNNENEQMANNVIVPIKIFFFIFFLLPSYIPLGASVLGLKICLQK